MGNSPIIPAAISILRGWGIPVSIRPEASTNGRSGIFNPVGVMTHHTASNMSTPTANSLRVIEHGRPDVAGPLSQFFVSRTGIITCVSYGRANHGGYGGPWRTIARDAANASMVGIEMGNNGIGERYDPKALDNSRHLQAALLIAMKRDPSWLIGHKEWAPGRKIDPTLNMDQERAAVGRIIRDRLTTPPPPATTHVRYTVRAGDTVYAIAEKHGTTVATLSALNGLRDADDLDIGQVLRIPALRVHVVQRGDTLTSIAEKYRVTIEGIVRVNDLDDPDNIQLGERLRIPPTIK